MKCRYPMTKATLNSIAVISDRFDGIGRPSGKNILVRTRQKFHFVSGNFLRERFDLGLVLDKIARRNLPTIGPGQWARMEVLSKKCTKIMPKYSPNW
ncbi:hypothetical protein DBT53_002715 [Aerococcus mictus]|uniref:hypothetical protein n=1 Tax=Aerococcus mictus TaxID=2976810 RepID=UPI002FD4247F